MWIAMAQVAIMVTELPVKWIMPFPDGYCCGAGHRLPFISKNVTCVGFPVALY